MTTKEETKKKPLWLSIEEKLHGLDAKSLSGERLESEIQRIARELDEEGYNVSRHGGNLLQLRWAMGDMLEVGRPLMRDLNEAASSLTLEDAADTYPECDRHCGGDNVHLQPSSRQCLGQEGSVREVHHG